ncbi:MAG: hypothetical protein ACRERE_08415 [Candidatus Entotheonellia bacterium]
MVGALEYRLQIVWRDFQHTRKLFGGQDAVADVVLLMELHCTHRVLGGSSTLQFNEALAGHVEHVLQAGELSIGRSRGGTTPIDGLASHAKGFIAFDGCGGDLRQAFTPKDVRKLLDARGIPIPGSFILACILQISIGQLIKSGGDWFTPFEKFPLRNLDLALTQHRLSQALVRAAALAFTATTDVIVDPVHPLLFIDPIVALLSSRLASQQS